MPKLVRLVRMLVVGTWFFLVAVSVSVLSLFRPFSFRNGALFRRWAFPTGRKILGVKLFVKHRERLQSGGPCIFIANHQHTLDMFVLGNVLPARTLTIGKKQLAWVPFFGWVFYLSGNLLIDRKDHLKAMETMRRARAEVEKGHCIFLTPEGTRRWGKGLGPFKKGAFHLAVEAQVPLQPIVCSTYDGAIDYGRRKAGQVIVDILEPISTEGKTEADVDALLDEAHLRMERALAAVDAELKGLS